MRNDRLTLWLHLVSEHAGIFSPECSYEEMIEIHTHEHQGPGTIRNHSVTSVSYDLKKVAGVLGELE